MGLFSKLKGELIDIIEWIDNSNGETISHRFERMNNEIKNGAKLTVRESQAAIFVNEGQFADIFTPGMYTLTTENLPILSTLKGWKHGFNSPFKAEVYFINTGLIEEIKWGTPGPLNIKHPQYVNIQMTCNGSIAIQIKSDNDKDMPAFFREVVKTDGTFTKDELKGRLRDLIIPGLNNYFRTNAFDFEAFDTIHASEQMKQFLAADFQKRGISIENFNILSYDLDEATKKRMSIRADAKAKAEAMGEYGDMNKYMQYQMGETMEKSVENGGGDSNMSNMMGAGMGFAMANQMANSMNNQNNQNNSGVVPPPVPGQLKFFIAVNGAQQGPYIPQQLQQMLQGGQFSKESLVWKEGMAAWTPAGQVPELASVFTSVPPPVPPKV